MIGGKSCSHGRAFTSASPGQKRSCTMCIATPRSNAPACACHAEPPTIWKILRQAGCIQADDRRRSRPMDPRQPGEEVQFD